MESVGETIHKDTLESYAHIDDAGQGTDLVCKYEPTEQFLRIKQANGNQHFVYNTGSNILTHRNLRIPLVYSTPEELEVTTVDLDYHPVSVGENAQFHDNVPDAFRFEGIIHTDKPYIRVRDEAYLDTIGVERIADNIFNVFVLHREDTPTVVGGRIIENSISSALTHFNSLLHMRISHLKYND